MQPDLDLLSKLQIENEDVYGLMVIKALENVVFILFKSDLINI